VHPFNHATTKHNAPINAALLMAFPWCWLTMVRSSFSIVVEPGRSHSYQYTPIAATAADAQAQINIPNMKFITNDFAREWKRRAARTPTQRVTTPFGNVPSHTPDGRVCWQGFPKEMS
jgi:hypothetical protein